MSVEWDEELVRTLKLTAQGATASRFALDTDRLFTTVGTAKKIVRLADMAESEHARADAEHTARLEAEAQARHLAVENGRTAARMMMAEDARDALAEKVEAARRILELRDVGWFESLAAILSDQEGR